ncbi:unnamed protein product [Caenorhabditis auriculariae]|uniref:Protein SON n=1 Tax=Caenorhabditis auriculariae TaxID=2777116 RepID=A0A8S1GYR1_9PELO|nr:unnamed protein product [Caenorhabditis auriculariae]
MVDQPSSSKNGKLAGVSSDAIVADLLKDVGSLSEPFSFENLTSSRKNDEDDDDEKDKKKKKHKHKHKHKSKKKKKKHERDRSKDREKTKEKKKKKSKSRSRSSSRSSAAVPTTSNGLPNTAEATVPKKSVLEEEDDDLELPVGADYRSVLKEAKMSINIKSKLPPLELSKLPCDPNVREIPKQEIVPLTKDDSNEKNTSEILAKVIEAKGKGDFIPRNVKIKSVEKAEKAKIEEKEPQETKINGKVEEKTNVQDIEVSEVEDGYASKNGKNIESEKVEKSDEEDKKKRKKRDPEKEKKSSKRARNSRTRNESPNTDDEIKEKIRKRKDEKSRSRSRDRRRISPDRWEKRKRSPIRSSWRRTSRSRSRDRRSRSRSRNRDRKASPPRRSDRRGRSRSRSPYRNFLRRRSRSDDRRKDSIDKNRLLEIARKKAQKMQMLGLDDRRNLPSQSIDDFVSYCQRIQKRQEKEARREKGEAVSSGEDSDDGEMHFKHPYPLPKTEPIRINIMSAATSSNSTQKAITASEEVLDHTKLRLVFPVSSGVVHKESTEWKPILKDETVLKSCTNEQKSHVAMTSLEAEKCKQMGLPVALPAPMAPLLSAILPPPPPPPKFLPEPSMAFQRPLTPPPLPPVLYVPPKDHHILTEPDELSDPPPGDLTFVLKQRADAQKRLSRDPNDFGALRELKDANEQMATWAALKSLPGKFTGSTGVNILKPEELQPHDPRYHAWVKKDMFKNAQPTTGGVGMRMLQKMGWKPGEGLGKEATGNIEPLMLDVKSDRKGLLAEEEMPAGKRSKIANVGTADLTGKHPVSLLMELCAKRKWPNPTFTCQEFGPSNCKEFLWKVVVNGVEYQPVNGSRVKKDGKSVACQVVLQSMGLIPRDPNLPVVL